MSFCASHRTKERGIAPTMALVTAWVGFTLERRSNCSVLRCFVPIPLLPPGSRGRPRLQRWCLYVGVGPVPGHSGCSQGPPLLLMPCKKSPTQGMPVKPSKNVTFGWLHSVAVRRMLSDGLGVDNGNSSDGFASDRRASHDPSPGSPRSPSSPQGRGQKSLETSALSPRERVVPRDGTG